MARQSFDIPATLRRVGANDREIGKLDEAEMRAAIYAKPSSEGGTYADVRLALAYAEYLNPKLAVEVKEVFLRYKVADATLADDILERASAKANEWAGTRALARIVRTQYTQTLRDHGATGSDYGACTNTLYNVLFDKTAVQMKAEKGLSKTGNLRNNMTTSELVFVMAGETLSSERIEEEKSEGGPACRLATSKSARRIRDAIDADRRDRRATQRDLF